MMDTVKRYFYAKDLPLCEDVVSVVLRTLARLYQEYDPAVYDAEAYFRDRDWNHWLERYMWSPRERDRIIRYYYNIKDYHMVCDVDRLLHLGPQHITERLATSTVKFLEGSLSREKYRADISGWFTFEYTWKKELGRLHAILSILKHPTPRAKIQAAIDVIEYVEAKKIGK